MKEIGICELCPESFRGKIEDNERREAREFKITTFIYSITHPRKYRTSNDEYRIAKFYFDLRTEINFRFTTMRDEKREARGEKQEARSKRREFKKNDTQLHIPEISNIE